MKTTPTPGVAVVSIDERDEENVEPKSDTGVDEEDDILGTKKMPSKLPKQSKHHTKDLETEILTKSIVLLESATNRKRPAPDDDGEELFGRHAAKSLKTVTDKWSRELPMMKIQQILFEVEFGVYTQQSSNPLYDQLPCSSSYYQT